MQQLAIRTAVLGLFVLVVSLSSLRAAEAGCLAEFRTCGGCAERRFDRGFWNLDFEEMAYAFEDALDCEIDLIHCIGFGQHHRYRCR